MSAEVLSTLMARSIALTPKEDKQGAKVQLKVFWKTLKFWSSADIADFQKNVPGIAERLRTEQYWDKQGNMRGNKFTCEDFAIRLLCEYAEPRGLPVKLTTGVRTFRNMEIYSASEHDRYASNINGYTDMVMLSYGAPDMQRAGINTIAITKPEEVQAGDVFALTHDLKGQATSGRAHHIQVAVARTEALIAIYQGNSRDTIHFPITWLYRLVGKNVADPRQEAYAGMTVERGLYQSKDGKRWDYTNTTTGKTEKDFLRLFDLFRWNFMEFNK
ncbi:hypothetical protein [Herbaspirillum rubrisubalbicans]|uniref:hypothetical protein n=1 Tax=Herbaspirillum rubrisubalbicans TaxID=80842 RepID=UPI00073A51A1|nr:hypothetical protein [Herbaspirillum rubrisubalbicans]